VKHYEAVLAREMRRGLCDSTIHGNRSHLQPHIASWSPNIEFSRCVRLWYSRPCLQTASDRWFVCGFQDDERGMQTCGGIFKIWGCPDFGSWDLKSIERLEAALSTTDETEVLNFMPTLARTRWRWIRVYHGNLNGRSCSRVEQEEGAAYLAQEAGKTWP